MEEIYEYARWIAETLEVSRVRKKYVRDIQPTQEDGEWVYKEGLEPMILAYKAAVCIVNSITRHVPLTSVCSNIGVSVLGNEYLNKDMSLKDANIQRVDIGYHLLTPLFNNKVLAIRKGKKPRDPYAITVVNDEFVDNMMCSINAEPLVDTLSRPCFVEPEPYTSFYNKLGGRLVHKCNKDAVPHFTYDNCPTVFDAINKHQRTPYEANTKLLRVFASSLEDDLFTFKDLEDVTAEQLIGMRREQTAVLDIAKSIGTRRFWQRMFYDFRGRLYSSLVYFSPQGNKLAKSLILCADKKPLGSEGWHWLLTHTANCWGEDKLPMDGRAQFAEDNLDEWMLWASDLISNKEWQKADSPFEFAAAILELRNAQLYKDGKEAYPSGLLVAWDATCSGLQVLSALARDSKGGDLCNLTNDGERGDYYKMIADHIWPQTQYKESEVVIMNKVTAKLARYDRIILGTSNKARKTKLYEMRKQWMEENREDIRAASRVFWGRPEVAALKRKLVKRPCMTYFYSCQAKTMAKSLMSDFQNTAECKGLNLSYALWLTSRIYKACQELMPVPTALMDAFIDLGVHEYGKDKDLALEGPFNKFLFMQNYKNAITKRVEQDYKGKRITLRVLIGFESSIDYRKVTTASSPNCVHMYDGQIVSAVIMNADYNINCIHDSFGTVAADAGKLYEDTRKCFVDIFNNDILTELETEKDFETNIEFGDLNLLDALDDEYIFS